MSGGLGDNLPVEHLDPARYWIAIIGMGAGGSGLLGRIVDEISAHPHLAKSIGVILVDQRPESEFGKGIAWGSNQSLLFQANMRTDTLPLRPETIKELREELGQRVPGENGAIPFDNQFDRRVSIGNILHKEYCTYRKIASENDITISTIHMTCHDINRTQRGFELFCTHGDDSRKVFVDFIALAIGNVAKRILPEHIGNDRYIENPWNWAAHPESFEGKTVGIIGLGPTAVDNILLAGQKRATKIIAFSPSGLLQYPRPLNVEYQTHFLRRDYIERFLAMSLEDGEDRQLSYGELDSFIIQEFSHSRSLLGLQEDPCTSFKEAKKASPGNEQQREMLYRGIGTATSVEGWYSVLKGIDEHTPAIWNSLSPEAKKQYLRKRASEHNRMSYGMAYQQAKRLAQLLDDHQLTLEVGSAEKGTITLKSTEEDKGFVLKLAGKEYSVDFIMNCSGIGSSQSDFNSPLIDSLVTKGWLVEDKEFGGFLIDFETGQLVAHHSGFVGSIYAITGSLTRGAHLLTNCLSQVLWSGKRTGEKIVSEIRARLPNVS
jgi:uncharacterized NAD(P)/FAD-binding protein YdhS